MVAAHQRLLHAAIDFSQQFDSGTVAFLPELSDIQSQMNPIKTANSTAIRTVTHMLLDYIRHSEPLSSNMQLAKD